MDCEFGKCEVCGKEAVLTRTYTHYKGLKCDCHSPRHFDVVRHCPTCVPSERRTTAVTLTVEQAKYYGRLAAADVEGRLVAHPCKPGDTVWVLRNFHDKKVPICGTVTELLFTEYWHPLIVVYGVGRGLWGKTVFATKEEALQKGQIK